MLGIPQEEIVFALDAIQDPVSLFRTDLSMMGAIRFMFWIKLSDDKNIDNTLD